MTSGIVVRGSQIEAEAGASGVVVLGVLGEDGAQVLFAGDEEAVCAFAAYGAYPPLREGVRPWALRRRRDDLDVVAGEDGVEGGGELGIAITDEEPETPGPLAQVRQQITGELRHPFAGRMCGDAEHVDVRVLISMTKKR
jgi:hypothetical protein